VDTPSNVFEAFDAIDSAELPSSDIMYPSASSPEPVVAVVMRTEPVVGGGAVQVTLNLTGVFSPAVTFTPVRGFSP
jgi:hypothetical protein